MQHELFHAYQDKVAYSGGISQYGSAGRVNIEFEQALFADIIYGTNMFDNIADESIRTPYENWRNSLTSNSTMYPNLSNFSDYQSEYHEFLNHFNTYSSYGNGTIIALEPEALKLIFNGLQINSCGQ